VCWPECSCYEPRSQCASGALPQLHIALFAFLAATLQTSLFTPFALAGAKPDLLLTLAIFLALYGDEEEWPLRFWLLGLFKDVLSVGPLGLHAFTFAIAAIAAGKLRREIFRDHPINRALVVFFAALLANGTAAILQAVLLNSFRPGMLLTILFAEATYTAALAPAIMSVLMRFRLLLGIRRTPDISRAL